MATIITGVIVADDDHLIRSVLRAKLEALDVNVLVASNGLEAVAFASRIKAALIILDLKMPHMNGLIACERIRQLPGNAQTPIVILTSLPGKEVQTAAKRVGATGWFTKPFRPALLLQEVAPFLPINSATRDLIRHNAELASAICRFPTTVASTAAPEAPGVTDLHDRGKDILAVLRG